MLETTSSITDAERKAGALLLEVPRIRHRENGGNGIRAMLAQIKIAESTARRWQYLAPSWRKLEPESSARDLRKRSRRGSQPDDQVRGCEGSHIRRY